MSVPRGYLLNNRGWFPLDGRLHKLWWHWSDTVPALWPWRWLCWLDGGHDDDGYGSCVRCRKPTEATP